MLFLESTLKSFQPLWSDLWWALQVENKFVPYLSIWFSTSRRLSINLQVSWECFIVRPEEWPCHCATNGSLNSVLTVCLLIWPGLPGPQNWAPASPWNQWLTAASLSLKGSTYISPCTRCSLEWQLSVIWNIPRGHRGWVGGGGVPGCLPETFFLMGVCGCTVLQHDKSLILHWGL